MDLFISQCLEGDICRYVEATLLLGCGSVSSTFGVTDGSAVFADSAVAFAALAVFVVFAGLLVFSFFAIICLLYLNAGIHTSALFPSSVNLSLPLSGDILFP